MSNAPHKILKYKISQLKQDIEKRQQNRRQKRLEDLKKPHDEPTAIASKPNATTEVAGLFGVIRAGVLRDQHRLNAAPETPPMLGATPVVPPFMPTSPILAQLVEAYTATEPLIPPPSAEAVNPIHTQTNPHVLALLRYELGILIETNTQQGNIPGPLLAKLKQAVQAYAEGRTTDTLTVLKTALTGDPHNQTLLMCLSQVLYGLAASGTATALPEARDVAQRSIIANQKQRPPRLAIYQYIAIVTERSFGEERALEWLRDTELLDPSTLQSGREGLLAMQGIPLRAWCILASINPTLWGEAEFKALRHLATHVIGGGAVYYSWLREPLLQAAAMSKTPLPELEELERMLLTAITTYTETTEALRQIPPAGVGLFWVLRQRWLQTFVQLVGVPAFDTILCLIALDGQSWREKVYPDRELQALLDDSSLQTWRVWAQVLTPFKDMRKPYLMPAEDVVAEADLQREAEAMLALLKEAETERVKADLWPDLRPWLVRWQLEHFLATATGSNQPRNRFAPTLFPYSNFYRRWQEPQISALLASEVIMETAKCGGFASWLEVLSAFEGALRLMDDPHHGLQATQRRAYEMARKRNPAKFASRSTDFGRVRGSGAGLMLAPLGFIGALVGIITMADNTSQAIGLSLALFGLAGVVMLNLSKK